jgi:hypothetical protein
MGLHRDDLDPRVGQALADGVVIPAHPLALDRARKLDERRQTALARYYIDAGVGGLAVGVHTTQFAIRDHGLYEPVLRIAMQEAQSWTVRPLVMVAGAIGSTRQACAEAAIARSLGYHAVLLSLAAMSEASDDELIAHCRAVAAEMPLTGFYLQPAVGGRVLTAAFWQRFAALDNVVAIKIAPFNRYRTLDVLRGVVAARAERRVALYTGNDDHIVLDLLTPFGLLRDDETVTLRIRGGLLGHWSVQTKSACDMFERIKALGSINVPSAWLALDAKSRTAMLRCSTWPTVSRAASPVAMKCCGARDCWKASSAWTRQRPWVLARPPNSIASGRPTLTWTTVRSSVSIGNAGWPSEGLSTSHPSVGS